MKFTRVGLAIILTVTLLIVARNTSRGRPERISASQNQIAFQMVSVPKVEEHAPIQIEIDVSGELPEGYQVIFRKFKSGERLHSKDDNYAVSIMKPSLESPGRFATEIVGGNKGGRTYYFFEVRDSARRVLATFKPSEGNAFFTKYIGVVPGFILIGHIFLMFATVFCVVMAALHGVAVLRGDGDTHNVAWWAFLGMVASFLGGYPFGFGMNHYAFGVVWEGVPFGTDATDNKTQLLFLYFLLVTLTSLRSLSRGKCAQDLLGSSGIAKLGISALVFLALIYLIPHSIQFSSALTYGVCYGFIGILLVWYVGLLSRRAKVTQSYP